jgi:predicted ATPase
MITDIKLINWKNFRKVDVSLRQRMFIVGPNASGKSNLLDAFRFLHDIGKQGLQEAIEKRGGFSKIRCLAARRDPLIKFEVHISELDNPNPVWVYSLGIAQEAHGLHKPYVKYELVEHCGQIIIDRTEEKEKNDFELLYETYLQHGSTNVKFRAIAKFFEDIRYFHIVPQLIRHSQSFTGPSIPEDPFGRNFLELLAKTTSSTRESRLRKIEAALKVIVPSLTHLSYTTDTFGFPHLEVRYEHWRPDAGKQNEEQLSDGTIRLIGLLWSLLEIREAPLLLEEPELSLNTAIIRQLPSLMYNIEKKKKIRGQIFISTHSADLLYDRSIGAEDVLLLEPTKEGTVVKSASNIKEIQLLLEKNMSVGEAVIPILTPKNLSQVTLSEFMNA